MGVRSAAHRLLLCLLAFGLVLAAGSASADDSTPAALPPLQISDIQVSAVSPFSATVSWQTNEPATDQVSYGFTNPVVWTPVSAAMTTSHQVVVPDLSFNQSYTLNLLSADISGQTARAITTVTTPGLPSSGVFASTKGSEITINGSPIFPFAEWDACHQAFPALLDEGITLFMNDTCGDFPQYLGSQALSMTDINKPGPTVPGSIGFYYPDEWDAYLTDNTPFDALQPQLPPSSQTGQITFLNMSNHFYSGAPPFPNRTKAIYPLLEQLPDVIGSDIYPMQGLCYNNNFVEDYTAQQELAATGKPSFQWIEDRVMNCAATPALSPSAATVRAEAWLAIAGGATALGYFPYGCAPVSVCNEISSQNSQITALAPALLQPVVPVTVSPGSVVASARELNGAIYLIVVNSDRYNSAKVKITVPGLQGRTLTSYDRSLHISPVLDSFSETLAPLASQLLIATPDGS